MMRWFAVLLCMVSLTVPAMAADYYIAPEGLATNAGTLDSPWDIQSAWGGKQKIEPGSTVYMKPGVYRHPDRLWGKGNYVITNISGTQDQPIHIRPMKVENDQQFRPGHPGRVTIDGGMSLSKCNYLWLWDLEFTISESSQWSRRIEERGSHPKPDLDQPQGGISIISGTGCKFINLIVHDNNGTGVGFWKFAYDAELHGNLISRNGWMAPDRAHGPGLYTQNFEQLKFVTDNIFIGNYSTTIQAYGSSKVEASKYRFIGNIMFAPFKPGRRARMLIGGGKPSKDIVYTHNIAYNTPVTIGYTAPYNEDCIVTDNLIVNAGLSISKYKQVTNENNTILAAKAPRPEVETVVLRPNLYDTNRANLAILNWNRASELAVDVSSFLKPNDTYQIVNTLDYYGKPVAEGVYDGQKLTIPFLANDDTGEGEIGVFVIFRRPVAE